MQYIASLLILGLSAGFVAACRLLPALAEGWRAAVFAPVAGIASRASAALPFPLAELLALLLVAVALFLLLRSRRGLCLMLAIVLSVGVLSWVPAYYAGPAVAASAPADAEALSALSARLIGELNAAGPFSAPGDLPEGALAAARLATLPAPVNAAPKFARYPEWMEAFSLAGVFVPWTFEALIDPGGGAPGLPFTAVHELMHMGGVADEGEANILAYEACLAYGGAFAHSAKLWALKYALLALHEVDYGAWYERAASLGDEARADFRSINGFARDVQRGSAVEAFLRLGGMAEKAGNYGALANYLCMDS